MRVLSLLALALLSIHLSAAPSVIKEVHETSDPTGPRGVRPYEMDWAHRLTDQRTPQEDFEKPLNWSIEEIGGAEATFGRTREQQLFGSFVARLSYQGVDPGSMVVLRPDDPIPLPPDFDCVNIWIYGNNWDWARDPKVPQADISVLFNDSAGAQLELPLVTVRWKEWWLVHKRVPDEMLARLKGGAFTGLRIRNTTNKDPQQIYFDNLVFYKEDLKPLTFNPRPKRGVDMFPGQSSGLNTGPGRLPFPTREQTILPMQLGGLFTNTLTEEQGAYTFTYTGADGTITYRWRPADGPPNTVTGHIRGQTLEPLSGASVEFGNKAAPALVSSRRSGDAIEATYDVGGHRVQWTVRLWQKSLVVDCVCKGGEALGLTFGRFAGTSSPRLILTPYLTVAPGNPTVLMARGPEGVYFGSVWADWYRSNGSGLYAETNVQASSAQLNGGVRYTARTDGKRNDLYERFFVTLSPVFEEVYPTIDNPPAENVKLAGRYLWQESWGPENYQTQMDRSGMLASYGITNLIQCNHEITWRDHGESFTLRTRAAPGKGGDEALERYIRHQKSLGWRAGLYTNYTDMAPVNEHWNEDSVQRLPDGDWRAAWPRNYALKPSRAVELDAELAPQVQKKFATNAAYTDVQTAVAPWAYNDFDARVPGAGTFAQTFYCYGELLLNDQKVYGIVHSEGSFQCYYAGLATGNYGLCYPGVDPAAEPLNVAFDLYQIHPKEADIGVPWTDRFFQSEPGWDSADRIDASIDHFLAATLAYGHIGWLVEEQHGISRMCRSYYMLRPVTQRYAGLQPKKLQYADADGRLASASEALDRGFFSLSRLHVDYGAIQLYVNGSTDLWEVDSPRGRLLLPSWGWAAWSADGKMFESSALSSGERADYCVTPDYEYLDGRGTLRRMGKLACAGGVVMTGDSFLDIGANTEIGFKSAAEGGQVEAFDAKGKSLGKYAVRRGQGGYLWFQTVPEGRTYRFTRGAAASAPSEIDLLQAIPGQTITGAAGASVQVPASAKGHTWLSLGGRLVDVDVVRELPLVISRVNALNNGSLRLTVIAQMTGERPALILQGVNGVSATLTPSRALDRAGEYQLLVKPLAGRSGPASLTLADSHQPGLVRKIDLTVLKGTTLSASLTASSWIWNWGTLDRHGKATPADTASGAQWAVQQITSGGVEKHGIFTHPPYLGKVGAVYADSLPFTLAKNATFFSYIGIKDGAAFTDGVVFSVWVLEDGEPPVRVAEQMWAEKRWTPLEVDLSKWAGKQITLRLMSDCGPKDNSTSDWGAWGEPQIRSRRDESVVTLAK